LEALVPILVRPVREQLEHDRIIRLLEAKWRRKFKVDANPGDERNVGVKVPVGTLFPDLILTEEGGRKPKALVEVETNESVNHLEAMAQWAHLAKSKTALSLIVPSGAVEAARRLASENGIKLTEVWTYHVLGDQVRFTSVFREQGADPADLIEKVDAFTTERAAPAPRPVPVEPVEAVEPPAPVEVERPRKLAVKAGSRPVVDGLAGKIAPKMAIKAGAKAAIAEPPAAAGKPVMPVKATPAKVEPAPAKPAPGKPVAAIKPVAAAKSLAPAKPVAPAKPAAPVKAAAPVKLPPPAKTGVAAKPVIAAKSPAVPVKAAATKPADKVPAKKVAAKPEVKKAAPAKAAPAKPAGKPAAAKKPVVAAKPAPRPAARKAVAPVRPAPRAAAAKKAAPVAKARPAKRK
jgi:hypothetical protein